MNWIVLWTVITFVSEPCPDYKPDPYTGEFPSTHCLVNHGKQVKEVKLREFQTEEEAKAFIEAGPKDVEFVLVRMPAPAPLGWK